MTTAELKYVAGDGSDTVYHVIDEHGEVKCGARLDPGGRSETIPHLDAALFQSAYQVCQLCEEPIPMVEEPESPSENSDSPSTPSDDQESCGRSYRPVVELLNVSKLKLNAEAGKVRVQFEVQEAQSLHLGSLLRMAIGGTADVTIRGHQREFQMDDTGEVVGE